MTPAVRRRAQAGLSRFLRDPDEWVASIGDVGQPHALAVANATLDLWAALRGLDVHGANVITTPYTWGGSLAGIIQSGDRPIFADVDGQTLTLDPESVLARITPQTEAVLLVDIYGHPCNGPAFREIADAHGLLLVQDCAQSFGAFLESHHTGFWADAAVFSFTCGKALFAGEGGMVVTRHAGAFERMVRDTQHPMRQRRDIPRRSPNEFALNLRINPLAAAWALAVFDDALATVERTRLGSTKLLEDLYEAHASMTAPPDLTKIRPSFHVLTVEPRGSEDRIGAALRRCGPAWTITPPPVRAPLYRDPAYRELAALRAWPTPTRCRVAETQGRRRVRLKTRSVRPRSTRKPAPHG
jgi:dTDP-4-amino-4,6-dideoxygalactose transaminase